MFLFYHENACLSVVIRIALLNTLNMPLFYRSSGEQKKKKKKKNDPNLPPGRAL